MNVLNRGKLHGALQERLNDVYLELFQADTAKKTKNPERLGAALFLQTDLPEDPEALKRIERFIYRAMRMRAVAERNGISGFSEKMSRSIQNQLQALAGEFPEYVPDETALVDSPKPEWVEEIWATVRSAQGRHLDKLVNIPIKGKPE